MGTRIMIVVVALLVLALIVSSGLESQDGYYGQRQGRFVRGDFDLDGQVCMTDAVGLLRVFWGQDCYPLCEDSADANDDARVDLSDAIWILDTVFNNYSRWASLGCGPDMTLDGLGCEYDSQGCEGDAGQDQGLPQDPGYGY